jgi:hypothetical protein
LVSGNKGVIKTIDIDECSFNGSLPLPPPLGMGNYEGSLENIPRLTQRPQFADVVGILYDKKRNLIVTLYSDKMLILWKVTESEEGQ